MHGSTAFDSNKCNNSANDDANSSSVILTVRIIRSFKYKNWRPLVVRDCDLSWSWTKLKSVVDEQIEKSNLPLPFKNLTFYDAFKLETDPTANNAKSSNALINTSASTPVINLNDDGSSGSSATLKSHQVHDEYEVSLFNLKDYEEYAQSLEN